MTEGRQRDTLGETDRQTWRERQTDLKGETERLGGDRQIDLERQIDRLGGRDRQRQIYYDRRKVDNVSGIHKLTGKPMGRETD